MCTIQRESRVFQTHSGRKPSMPRIVAWFVVLVCVVHGLYVPPCRAADDPAPEGSEWIGTFKRFGRKDEQGSRISSTDARLKFLKRDDVKFKAELWLDRNSRGLAL